MENSPVDPQAGSGPTETLRPGPAKASRSRPELARPGRPSRRRRLLLIAAVLCAVPVAYVVGRLALAAVSVFGPSPLLGGGDGTGVDLSWSTDADVEASMIAARNSLSSTSSVTRSSGARFASRTVAVLNRSKHPLIGQVAAELVARLKKLPVVDRVDYFADGRDPSEGRLAPDLLVTLDLADLKESGGPMGRQLDARVVVTCGTALAHSRNSYIDHLTPPLVGLGWQATLDHHSTTTGAVSRSNPYRRPAENIAEQFAEALSKLWTDCYKEDGPLPKLPAAFYPDYRPAPPMPFLEPYKAERQTAYHGLMNHNETMWRLPAGKPLAAMLGDVQSRMEAAGWKTSSVSTEPNAAPHLRMTHGAAVLNVYPCEESGGQHGHFPRAVPKAEAADPLAFWVSYVDRMTSDEMAAAIDQTLREDADLDVILMFETKWNTAQQRRALEVLESRPPATAQAALVLARLYHGDGQDDRSRAWLRRTAVLMRTLGDPGGLDQRAKKLAKDLGDEKLMETKPDAELLREAGFVRPEPGGPPQSRETGLDEPIGLLGYEPDGRLQTVALRVVKSASADKPSQYQVTTVTCGEGHRSRSTSGDVQERFPSPCSVDIGNGKRMVVEVVKLPGRERFRWTWQPPKP